MALEGFADRVDAAAKKEGPSKSKKILADSMADGSSFELIDDAAGKKNPPEKSKNPPKTADKAPNRIKKIDLPSEVCDENSVKAALAVAQQIIVSQRIDLANKAHETYKNAMENQLFVMIGGRQTSIKEIIYGLNLVDIKSPHSVINGKRLNIPFGSNLAKLVQCYVIANNNPVFFRDHQSLDKSIDGNIGRFSIQAIAKMKKEILVGSTGQKVDWLKSGFYDAMRAVVSSSGKMQEDRDAKMDYNPISNSVELNSFGHRSRIVVSGNMPLMYLQMNGTEVVYPFPLPLAVNADTGEILMNSDLNKQNLKNAYRLCNFVHFVMLHYIYRSHHDGLVNPFNVSAIKDNIEFSRGILRNDDTVITNKKLAEFQFNAATGNPIQASDSVLSKMQGLGNMILNKSGVDAYTLTNFLNSIFTLAHPPKVDIKTPAPIVTKI